LSSNVKVSFGISIAGETTMKIIGAGPPRTATLTLKIALEMLGAGPCYHMMNILTDMSLTSQWVDALNGRADWHKIFDGFEATVDYPGAYFYRELMDAFPDAKVLLSVRDGESWARSTRDTVWGALWGDTLMHDLAKATMRISPAFATYSELMQAIYTRSGLLADDPTRFDLALSAAAVERYNEEVRQFVPRDRLLVWSPADGWEPLCEFIGAPVPEMPLPRVNDSKAFADRVAAMCMASLNNWLAEQTPAPSGH
jgi:hypothetical protein